MKKMSIEVRGKSKEWSFEFYGDPSYLKEWREDDLEINEIINTIPEWVVGFGLIRPWIFFQDLFNFRFRKE